MKREEGSGGDDALMAEMRSTYMPDKGEVSHKTCPVVCQRNSLKRLFRFVYHGDNNSIFAEWACNDGDGLLVVALFLLSLKLRLRNTCMIRPKQCTLRRLVLRACHIGLRGCKRLSPSSRVSDSNKLLTPNYCTPVHGESNDINYRLLFLAFFGRSVDLYAVVP